MGVASTLFVREQRTELLQLERTLGIRVERMPVDMSSPQEKKRESQGHINGVPSVFKSQMVQLPGEFLQAQMET